MTTTAEKLRQIEDHINQWVFERRVETRLITLGALTREHVFFHGAPGCAKTEMVDMFGEAIEGAVVFGTQFHPNKPPESLFGRTDLVKFTQTGELMYDTTGYLPSAHFFKADEIWKGNPANHDPMLSIFNERKFFNDGVEEQCPLIMALGTSNEFPESDESVALYDRFLIRRQVSMLREKRNLVNLLDRADEPAPCPVRVTLAELQQAQQEVMQVQIPQAAKELLISIRTKLQSEGVQIGDRRFRKAAKVLRANAYLAGRTVVEEEDLEVLQHIFWDVPEQVPVVAKVVLATSSPDTQELMGIGEALDAIVAGVHERKGQSDENLMAFGAQKNKELQKHVSKVADLKQKLAASGRSLSKVEEIEGRLDQVRALLFEECLGVKV